MKMRLVKVAKRKITEKRVESFSHFCLSEQDEHFVFNSEVSNENYAFELIFQPTKYYRFPFRMYRVPVPEHKPLTAIIHDIPLEVIYTNIEDPLENQQLALEPLYIVECTNEQLKSKSSQTFIAPKKFENKTHLLGSLNAFGSLVLYKSLHLDADEYETLCNVTDFLIDNTPKENVRSIRSFKDFRDYIGKIWIYSFTWEIYKDKYLLYVGTAYGEVIVLEWIEESNELKELYRFATNLERLSFMKVVDKFLLVASAFGLLKLYRLVRSMDEEDFFLSEAAVLWSKKDHIGCRQAEIVYSKPIESHLVVIAKGANLIFFRLASDGTLLERKHINTNSIKITGIVVLNETDYLVSTLVGKIFLIRINFISGTDFTLSLEQVQIDFDSKHYQILSFVSTINKVMFALVQYRNEEYVMLSKKRLTSGLIRVYTLDTVDYLQEVIDRPLVPCETYIDFLCGFRANLLKRYSANYRKLNKIIKRVNIFDESLNDEHMLRLVQIKLNFFQILYHYERIKYYKFKKRTATELNFLKIYVRMQQIYCRLRYLSSLSELTDFQTTAASNMQQRFKHYSNLLIKAFEANAKEEKMKKAKESKEKEGEADPQSLESEKDQQVESLDEVEDDEENEDEDEDQEESNTSNDEVARIEVGDEDKNKKVTEAEAPNEKGVTAKRKITFNKFNEKLFYKKAKKLHDGLKAKVENLRFQMEIPSLETKCPFCSEVIPELEIRCSQKHPSTICPISSILMCPYSDVYCSHCNTVYYEDKESLQQLYPNCETLTCSICNFQLRSDALIKSVDES